MSIEEKKCEDYKRSVFFAVTYCSRRAKFIYDDGHGRTKLVCGIHAKMYNEKNIKPLEIKP